ncbi:MAG: isoprenylcysteine carboxylmethyltransferase family protein [Pseudomonadota bacterium]
MTPKIPPPLVMLICAGVSGWLTPVWPQLNWMSPYQLAAVAIALCGIVVSALGARAFRRVKTTVNPLQPHTATTLVVKGIYHYSRNPMYLGLLLVLIAWTLFLQNIWALVVTPVVFVLYIDRFQIAYEERALTALFGESYVKYLVQVRRWV